MKKEYTDYQIMTDEVEKLNRIIEEWKNRFEESERYAQYLEKRLEEIEAKLASR